MSHEAAFKTSVMPFLAGAQDEKDSITYPIELACIVSMTEMQRKKTGFLRDTPEKIAYISRIHYPLWAVPIEDSCLLLDGLAAQSYTLTFKEPVNTGLFIEDLKKNSVIQQEFMNALDRQVKNAKDFAPKTNKSFQALIADKELLDFFLRHFTSGAPVSEAQDEKTALAPLEIDDAKALEAREAVLNHLRRTKANIKGIQYAIAVLNEEVEFHKHAISFEIERLKEKSEADISNVKPIVDEKVKNLTVDRDAAIAKMLKYTQKKTEGLEKNREKYMHKLQEHEQKKDSAKKRKKGAVKYELERYDRSINSAKKEVKAITDAIENIRKEGNKKVKEVEEEFRRAVALEEEKITKIRKSYESRIALKKEQIETLTSSAASITQSLESLMEEIEREAEVFREQITINWKLDSPVLLRVPAYIVKYTKEQEERYSLFSPTTISDDTGVLKGLRKIFTFTSESRLKLVMRPSSTQLQELLSSSLKAKMQEDDVFRENLNTICHANNLLRMERLQNNA